MNSFTDFTNSRRISFVCKRKNRRRNRCWRRNRGTRLHNCGICRIRFWRAYRLTSRQLIFCKIPQERENHSARILLPIEQISHFIINAHWTMQSALKAKFLRRIVVQALGFRAMVRKIFFPRRIAHHAMQCGCALHNDCISWKTVEKRCFCQIAPLADII